MTNRERIDRLSREVDRCLALANGRITGLELELLQLAEALERVADDLDVTAQKALRLEARIEALESAAITVHYPGTEEHLR